MNLLQSALDLFIHLDVHLAEMIIDYGAWVYLILFSVIFLETGVVLMPFLPGDSLIFAAGTLSAVTSLKIYWLWPLFFVAAVLGDTVNYWLGERLGEAVFARYPRWFKPAHLVKAKDFYLKHGAKTVVLARFFPIIRTVAPFVAGVAHMPYRTFLIYNLVGAFIWTTIFTLGGYFFGNIPMVKEHFEWVIVAILLISFIPLIRESWRHRRAIIS